MAQYAELEIALRRHEADGYPVELRFVAANSDSEERNPASGIAYANILPEQLLDWNPSEYGKALGKALFADERIRLGLARARASVQAIEDGALRIWLYIDPVAEKELHQIKWETLCDADGEPLFHGTKILFSRYLASSNWQTVRGKTDMKALIVIANPPALRDAYHPEQHDADRPDSRPRLAPIDVPKERERAEAGFRKAGIPFQTLATGIEGLGPATSDQILDLLDSGFDILYLVCHGALARNGEPVLYLEEGPFYASKLVGRLRNSRIQPRLIILASCESAGGEATTATGTLSTLGPQLVDAGIPAVIAMQGKVKIATVEVFMPAFLGELAKESGQIDRAVGVARERAASAGCNDYWMPVLFLRLKSGRLWYIPGFQSPDGDFSQMESICRFVRAGECVPIVGPGVGEHIFDSPRKLAATLARQEHFPLHSYQQTDIAKVTQFILTQHSPEHARSLVVGKMIESLQDNAKRILGEEANGDDLLDRVVRTCSADENDPMTIVASLNAKVFVNASSDSTLEKFLQQAKKDPVPLLVDWRDEREKFRQFYPETTAQKPYVYYVFGKATEKDNWVLTEDDFFDYMMQTAKYDLMPGVVSDALVAGSLLFLGFHLDDWTFRVLFRMILAKGGSELLRNYNHVGVQVDPGEATLGNVRKARKYMERYFRNSKIDIFWGTPAEFLSALKLQLEKIPAASAAPAMRI